MAIIGKDKKMSVVEETIKGFVKEGIEVTLVYNENMALVTT